MARPQRGPVAGTVTGLNDGIISGMVGRSFLSPVIGRITNDISDLIRMNAELEPKMLIPVHWGTFSHYSETISLESFGKYQNIKIVNVGESVNISR